MEARRLAEAIEEEERARHARDKAMELAAEVGYRQGDLVDAGASVRQSKAYLAQARPSTTIRKTGSTPTDPATPQPEEVVTIVPADSEYGARELLANLGAYFRLEDLHMPVPMAASWIGVTEAKELRRLYPVEMRAYVPSASAPFGPEFSNGERHRLRALLATPDYQDVWANDPTAVFMVGSPYVLPRAIPLGYAKGGVAGTRSYIYEELMAARQLNATQTWRESPKLTLEKVQAVLEVLPDDRVTSYAEIGKAYGRPNAGLAVAKIVGRKEIYPGAAARVIGTTYKNGREFRMVDSDFVSHHGVKLRSIALASTGVRYRVNDGNVYVSQDLWIQAEELRELIHRPVQQGTLNLQ